MKNKKRARTFKELKKIMPETEAGHLPGIKKLYKMTSNIYDKFSIGDGVITIFENGYFTYERNKKWTVEGLDRCDFIKYEMVDGEKKIPISEIENEPYQLVLYLIGDHRLEHNLNINSDYHRNFGLNNDGADWCKGSWVPGFVEEAEALVNRIETETKELRNLKNAFFKLTERQKEVIKLLYYRKMNQRDVARMLQTSQANISQTKNAAIKKMKKYFQK